MEFTAGHVLKDDASILVHLDGIVKSNGIGVSEDLKEEMDAGHQNVSVGMNRETR